MILKLNGNEIGIIKVVDLQTDTGLPLAPVVSIILTDPELVINFQEKMDGKDEETGIIEW